MHFSFSVVLFFSTLLLGTGLTISSSSWFGAWVGLELNLLSFIPLMITKNNQYSSEASLKYFLIQALGSSLVVFTASFMLFQAELAVATMLGALVLKLGGAPLHFWFPQVMNGLMWPQVMVLMTIQKVGPLFLLCYLAVSKEVVTELVIVSLLSASVGAVGGINQTSLRKILAFSSINHIGWMLSAMLVGELVMGTYFLYYCLVSLSVAALFQLKQMFHFNHLLSFSMPLGVKMLVFFSLLSLGGLPPFTGFVPKWMLIQSLASSGYFVLLVVLIMSALVTLYFYMRVSLLSLSLSAPKLSAWTGWSENFERFVPCLVFVNFFGLLVPIVL